MSWRLSGGVRLDELIRDLETRGEAFVIATVVRRQPPVSARVGDRAVITADGRIYGWVGGGCAHELILQEARAVLTTRRPHLLRITPEASGEGVEEEARTVAPMACPSRGELEVFLEPWVREPQLLIFGESPLARALALFGQALGYEVTQVVRDAPSLQSPGEIRIARLEALPGFSPRMSSMWWWLPWGITMRKPWRPPSALPPAISAWWPAGVGPRRSWISCDKPDGRNRTLCGSGLLPGWTWGL